MKLFKILAVVSVILFSSQAFASGPCASSADCKHQTSLSDSSQLQMDQMQAETESLPAPDQSQLTSSVTEKLEALCILIPEKVPDKVHSAQ